MASKKMSGINDIKKSSYYVWFLGAKESKGLRGEEYVQPVVKHLTGREKEQEPIKVTLQLSNKGIKIVQQAVIPKRPTDSYRDNIKHFIPHHAITCAIREDKPNDDVVSTILLIYNPATSCPVHVHCYRCDSAETAAMLHEQLQVLVDRPDNQKKFFEIESRLQEKGLLQRNASSVGSNKLGSDGRSLGRGSDSGTGSDKGSQLNPTEKIATMYDSLAAELREKLGSGGAKQPILLPPRDYDTVHRQKGNILGIEERKSCNPKIVGGAGGTGCSGGDSEGKSSGIGSDDASSPLHTRDFLANDMEDRSSSDDEWPDGSHPRVTSEDSLILVQPAWPLVENGGLDSRPGSQPLSSRFSALRPRSGSSPPAKLKPNNEKRGGIGRRQGATRNQSPEPRAQSPKERFKGAKQMFMSLERKKSKDKTNEPKVGLEKMPTNAQKTQEKLLKKEVGDKEVGKRSGDIRPSIALEERRIQGHARWSRYEQEQKSPGPQEAEPRWPKSDRDTGYASRYSRDKSRSRDFDESPPAARPNLFAKSGKKSSPDSKEKYTSKRLSRYLSRETLESDGYDQIEEFEEVEKDVKEKQRTKVKRQPSKTSLKLDYRRNNSRDSGRGEESPPEPPPGPRRGFLRREMTELDMKGYMQSRDRETPDRFGNKFRPPPLPLWGAPGPRERAMSPVRHRFVDEERFPIPGPHPERYPGTKVLAPEFRRELKPGPRGSTVPPDNRYPSLDLRKDKRKSMYDAEAVRRHYPEHNNDYRRRSYHELSDVDTLDQIGRNFQHSGKKVVGEQLGIPLGLPSRGPRISDHPGRGYKPLPDQHRYPGLDRETARANPLVSSGSKQPLPYASNPNHPLGPLPRGPRSFDPNGPRPPMFRHSYAEPSPPSSFARVSPSPLGRFGLASLKPY